MLLKIKGTIYINFTTNETSSPITNAPIPRNIPIITKIKVPVFSLRNGAFT